MQACAAPLESDAEALAAIHQEKTRLIMELLKSNDSLETINLLEEVRKIEKDHNEMKIYCEKKYNDSMQWVRFEGAYRRLLE